MRTYLPAWRGLFLFLGVLAILSLPSRSTVQHEGAEQASLAHAGQAGAKAGYFLHIDAGPAWQTTVTLTNLEDQPVKVKLSAYEGDGGFLGEIPAIRRVKAEATKTIDAETVLPSGSETLKLEASGNVVGSALFQTLDGTKAEAIPAIHQASQQLDFPPLLQGDQHDKTITLLNIDSGSVTLEVIAFDHVGTELERTLLSPLSPMASHTFAVQDVFSAEILQQLSTVRVLSDRSIMGLQLVDRPDTDLVGLPALTVTSREWSFPIVTTGGELELWTATGLFNPGEGSTAVTVEAFDVEGNSLGIIEATSLLPGAIHVVTTANVGGIIPSQATVLKVSADAPVTGYAVIGVKGGRGVTATLGIPAEDQTQVGFELTGSNDRAVLTVSPVVRMADGSIRSTVGAVGAGEWKETLLTTSVTTVNRTLGQAVAEGIPCIPEPTDMPMTYGDLITCAIDVVGDTDLFRFSGSTGERVVVQASRQSGGTPCVELFRPDGTRLGSPVCSYIGARLDATLPQTGTYTILVSESSNDQTVGYALALERVAPPSPSTPLIGFGSLLSDEINPIGDLDLFAFQATAGDVITVQASRQSGGTPCVELFRPDGTRLGSPVCSYIGARLDATLPQTGTNTILVSESSNDQTVGYALALDRVGPKILSISPNRGGDTGTVTVTITTVGLNLQGAVVVKLMRAGQPDIVGDPVSVGEDGQTIRTTFDLTGKAQGAWDVVVTDPDGTSATLPEGFTIEEGRPVQLWVDIVGRDQVLVGREVVYHIRYGNLGNIDTYDVVLIVKIPLNVQFEVVEERPEIEGVDWSQIPQGFEDEGEIVIPIWIYRIGANSTGEVEFKITLPVDQWAGGTPFSFGAELRQQTSDFSRTGNVEELEDSATFQLLLDAVVEAVCTVVSPPPDFCGTASSFARLDWLDSAAAVGANEELIELEEGLKIAVTRLVIGALAFTALGIIPVALIAAGGVWATLGGAAFVAITIGWGLSFYHDLTNLHEVAANGLFAGTAVQSWDPNAKAGPAGFSAQHFVPGQEEFQYVIFFENVETATAPAQEVVITDQLDMEKMDLSTFSLGQIAFGDKQVTPPPGLSEFTTDVDLRPMKNLSVRINARLDQNTGLLTWRFTSIDPATGHPPEDPLVGFLPPNVTPPEGEGSVIFNVMPKQGLATGTQVRNQATIVFDVNPPIDTPAWVNTLDNTKPTSQVHPLAATQRSPSFEVQWAGTDEGSGIKDYTIFVSEDGGTYTEWLRNTTDTSGTFTGQSGKSYAFYSVARDQTGNLEEAPTVPDATTRVKGKRGGSQSNHLVDEATREVFTQFKRLAGQGQRFQKVVQAQFTLQTFHRLPIGIVLPEPTALTGGQATIQLISTKDPNIVSVHLLSLTLEGQNFSFRPRIKGITGTLDLRTGAFHVALSFRRLMTPETPQPFTWEGTADGVYDFESGVVSLTEVGQGAFLAK